MKKNTKFSISIAVLAVFCAVLAAGCVGNDTSGVQNGPADSLFIGNVITVDDDNPTAEAVAVKDGIILFVGSLADAEKYCDDKTVRYDYTGFSIYPGFLESHMHVTLAGIREYGMAKLSPGVSLEENVAEMKAYIDANPGKDYYAGSGWTFSGQEPNSAMLDAICADKPVLLQTVDGHSVWVNTMTLNLLELTPEDIKEYGPAQIRVDADGKPTGYMSETPAIKLLGDLPFTVEDLKNFTLKWQEAAIADGFTAVCDAGIELFGKDKPLQAYKELLDEGKLKLRIYGLSMISDNTDTPEEDMEKIAGYKKELDNEYFKIIGAKVFLDGVIEAHSGWMIDEYLDEPGYHGVIRFSDVDKMSRLMIAADKYGLLVHSHCVGDGAAKMFADSVEEAVKVTGNYDQRNAAAHLQYLRPEEIERFGKLGIVAVSGYQWSPKNNVSYPVEEKFVGVEKAVTGYPAQSFIDAGAVTVGHTDYPISPLVSNPFAVYLGVKRSIPGYDESIRNAAESMSRMDSLKAITSNVAYSWHEEDRMGTLEAGKLANMAVLAVDLLNDDIETVGYSALLPTVATIIDGEVVYEASLDAE